MNAKTKTLKVCLDLPTYDWISIVAEKYGLSTSELAEQVLHAYLSKQVADVNKHPTVNRWSPIVKWKIWQKGSDEA